MHATILVNTIAMVQDMYRWSLDQVIDVYECVVDGINNPLVLLNAAAISADASDLCLDFDRSASQLIGMDSFQVAKRAFNSTSLISAAQLQAFELKNRVRGDDRNVDGQSDEGVIGSARPSDVRDVRRQRCRAVVQILWERDPSATVPDLLASEWIHRIACEGRPPSQKSFRRWVRDLHPNPVPGRRPA